MSNKLTILTQYLLTLTIINDKSDFATLMTSLLASFSPGSTCWAPGRGGRERGVELRHESRWNHMKRPTVKLRTTAQFANRVSARERNRSALNQCKRGRGGSWALTWRRGSGLAMASDRGWGRGGETFWATAAGQPFTEFLQFSLCFQFPRRWGKSGLLVRRIIRNDAVSSLQVYEQGSARSLFDFGANI